MTTSTSEDLAIVPGADYVPIMLDGRVQHLTATFAAARVISTKYGGVSNAVRRILDLDIDAVTDIVALGLGYTSPTKRPPKDLGEQVFRAGLIDDSEGDLAHRCVVFLKAVGNGGRVVKEATDVDGTEDAAPPEEGGTAADPQ